MTPMQKYIKSSQVFQQLRVLGYAAQKRGDQRRCRKLLEAESDAHHGGEQVELALALLIRGDAGDALCALHQRLLHGGRVQDASRAVPPAPQSFI